MTAESIFSPAVNYTSISHQTTLPWMTGCVRGGGEGTIAIAYLSGRGERQNRGESVADCFARVCASGLDAFLDTWPGVLALRRCDAG